MHDMIVTVSVFFAQRIPRPKARDWKKMEAGMVYKNGNTLRDYQLEGVNWLLFSWYHG